MQRAFHVIVARSKSMARFLELWRVFQNLWRALPRILERISCNCGAHFLEFWRVFPIRNTARVSQI